MCRSSELCAHTHQSVFRRPASDQETTQRGKLEHSVEVSSAASAHRALSLAAALVGIAGKTWGGILVTTAAIARHLPRPPAGLSDPPLSRKPLDPPAWLHRRSSSPHALPVRTSRHSATTPALAALMRALDPPSRVARVMARAAVALPRRLRRSRQAGVVLARGAAPERARVPRELGRRPAPLACVMRRIATPSRRIPDGTGRGAQLFRGAICAVTVARNRPKSCTELDQPCPNSGPGIGQARFGVGRMWLTSNNSVRRKVADQIPPDSRKKVRCRRIQYAVLVHRGGMIIPGRLLANVAYVPHSEESSKHARPSA